MSSLGAETAALSVTLVGVLVLAGAGSNVLRSDGATAPVVERQTFTLNLRSAPDASVSRMASDKHFGDCMSLDGAEMLDRPMSMKPFATVAMTGSPAEVGMFTACMDEVGIRYSPA